THQSQVTLFNTFIICTFIHSPLLVPSNTVFNVQGLCDLYVLCNGRVVDRDQTLQNGSIYHLEPRLRGGKGGFGSMLRALGAQIEKTTNREACRDLSGRRLRDVNHEKEMAEWLKKQAEREAEKEQRRLERLQKKLAEPKHHFTDAQYTQQCHELSERLEDSVIKGKTSPKQDQRVHRSSSCQTGLDLISSDDDVDQESDSEPGRESPGPEMEPHPERGGSDPVSAPPCAPHEPQSSSPEDSESEVQEPNRPGSNGSDSSPNPQRGSRPSPHPEESRPEGDPRRSGPDQVQRKPTESSSSPEQNQDQIPDQVKCCPQTRTTDSGLILRPEDLEALGLNVLKEELMRRGLKCGGTLSERAARLYSVRGKKDGEVEPGLRAKSKKKGK
uniref:Uncharacterized protein n=1 Tax=Periophthalmus magnuspinnatus TaxID=409849 RepID=A0A3B3ZZ30_9GOBI